jgi:quinol---cytochrome c reductase iron-sulfur subunit, bacillus type
MAAESPDTPGTTRRSFHVAAIHGLWGLITAALGVPALIYLLVPPKLRRRSEWVEAGDISKLGPNAPMEFGFRRNRVDGWKVISEKSTAWVVKFPDNRVVAYAPECTHLGCAYHWDQGRNEFVCPCHNSIFSIEGTVEEGPAPRPLDRYQTRIEGSKLLIGRLEPSTGQSAEPAA